MRITILLIFAFSVTFLSAQTLSEPLEGVVSYVTSQSVYVKFKSTKSISEGDTLFTIINEKTQAALLVRNLSSTSCVCTPLAGFIFKPSDKIFTGTIATAKSGHSLAENKIKPVEPDKKEPATIPDTTTNNDISKTERKQIINGRLSVASYTNLSNTPQSNTQRMRYTISLNAKNIANSRLSGETYISFAHRNKQWSEIQNNVFKGLKIYNLALKYEVAKNATIWAGRKINPKISNMGAVDGLQFEIKTNSITTGILAGSRPDYSDYGFNTSLLQYGVFLNHEQVINKSNLQTTIALVEQKNAGFTDRRFAYLQHSNSLIKNTSFFGSAEFDLYRYVKEVQDNSPQLSNLYLSLRYKYKNLGSVSLSYSERQNIIYYETYKSFIDQLLESETQKGYLLQVSYRPAKKLSVGATGGYRFRKSDIKASKNMYAYATYSQIPFLNISTTLSATIMETSFLNGNIFSFGFTKDLIPKKLSGTFNYRFIDYRFANTQINQMQHSGEISLNWRILKKLNCTFYYEGTFDMRYINNRFNIQVSKSF